MMNNGIMSRTAVAEICVPPDFLFPRTHIPSYVPGDICFYGAPFVPKIT